MRALVVDEGELTVQERPDPLPGPEELLVRVHGAGINAADLLQRRGFYPAPPGSPADIPGLEFAGVVEALGEGVHGFEPGDRVMAVVGGGAQAERCVVHASHALIVPSATDLVDAGGFPEAFSTAHDALVSQAHVREGDRVLVTGAAGGVGSAALQICRLLGAHAVASVRDVSNAERLLALGAGEVVLADDAPAHGPYDVVLELIGAASLGGIQSSLARHARVVVIGVGGGARVELDLLAIMATRTTITGSTLRARDIKEKASVAAGVRRDLLDPLGRGELHVPVVARYRLDDALDAYERFAAGSKLGKIIIDLTA